MKPVSKSPSKAELLHACPGALALMKMLPADLKKQRGEAMQKAADEGTAMHLLVEKCVNADVPPDSFLGRYIVIAGERRGASMLKEGADEPKEGTWFRVDSHFLRCAGIAYDYTKRRVAELGISIKDVLTEQWVTPLPDKPETKGRGDLEFQAWPVLELADYKNGRVTVEANTLQIASYLLGVAIKHNWEYTDYIATVIQPNAAHADGVIRQVRMTESELREFEAKHRAACDLADRAVAALADIPAGLTTPEEFEAEFLRPGEICVNCDCATACAARLRLTQAQLKADLSQPITELAPVVDVPDLVALVGNAKQIRAHLKAVEGLLLQRLLDGKETPGASLKPGRSTRRWKEEYSPAGIEKALVAGGFIGDNMRAALWTVPEIISGPQAEKLIDSKLRKKFAELFLSKTPGKLKVVVNGAETDEE